MSALRSSEVSNVSTPRSLPLHTGKARNSVGFRRVRDSGSGSRSVLMAAASGASQWGNSTFSHCARRSKALCSSSPVIINRQESPVSVSVPIRASALLASPVRSVRRLCHSIFDENVLHSVSTQLAGRACTPLGNSQINSTTRDIRSLLKSKTIISGKHTSVTVKRAM
ncbi:hypothetical protein D3C85_1278290 [compost metagenome]